MRRRRSDFATPRHLHSVLDVLRHRHVRKQRVLLEHRVDVPAAGRQPGDVHAAEPDDAGGGLFEAGDHAQHGGLARPGRAEDGEELAVVDGQVGAVDRDDPVRASFVRTPCARRSSSICGPVACAVASSVLDGRRIPAGHGLIVWIRRSDRSFMYGFRETTGRIRRDSLRFRPRPDSRATRQGVVRNLDAAVTSGADENIEVVLSYSVVHGDFSARAMLKYAAAAPAVLGLGGLLAGRVDRSPPTASAAPLGVLLDYAAGVIRATDIRAAGRPRRHPVRLRPSAGWGMDARQADPAARSPRPVPERAEDRLLLPVRQAGHRGLARRAGRWRAARQAGVAVARRRGWFVRRADLRIDRRRPVICPVQAAGRAISAGRGSRSSGISASGCTPTPRPSTGRFRTASVRTFGNTTGDRLRGSPIPLPLCIRSRSTSVASVVLVSTSTTS